VSSHSVVLHYAYAYESDVINKAYRSCAPHRDSITHKLDLKNVSANEHPNFQDPHN
jgi:hypothetical protein